MSEETNQKRKGLSVHWIYMGIIVLLSLAAIYLFITKNKEENKNELLSEEVETIQTDKTSIENEYQAALVRLDEMKSKSAQMDSLLNIKNDEVEALKNKIDAIVKNKNASEAELKKAASLIKELNNKLSGYEKQIMALKSENIQLTEEKRQLIEEKNEIQKDKENLQQDKKQLEETVELASVLHASNFKLEAINQKKNIFGKEKEKQTAKANRADKMRISFDIDDNRVSESGEKMIYISIKQPNGKIVTTQGNIIKTNEGKELAYTTSKIIPYKKGEKVYGVNTEWIPNEDFLPGTYTVEVYHMGFKIGSEKVKLN